MESHPPLFPFRGHYKAPAGLQPLGTHSTATKDGTDSSAKPSPYLPEGRQKGFGTSVEAVEAVERKKKEKKRAAHPTHGSKPYQGILPEPVHSTFHIEELM